MDKNNQKNSFKSKIGGQALVEGIMMRGIDTSAMACRLPDGTIDVETWPVRNGKTAPWYTKTPFIRGSFNFISSMAEGMRCTMKSAEKQVGDDDEEELSPFEEKLTKLFGDKLMNVIMIVMLIVAFAFVIVLFKFVPMLLSKLIFSGAANSDNVLKTAIEGIIKLAIMIGYFYIMSLTKSMHTTFMYHGAEHKTITCYEARQELTVENIKKMSRFHPRCGTSFIIIVVLIGFIVGLFLPWKNIAVRLVIQLLLLIPEASIAYELIKLAGRYDNIFTKIISAPGLWMQRITTKEPNDKQIEVAIAALKPCLPKNEADDQW